MSGDTVGDMNDPTRGDEARPGDLVAGDLARGDDPSSAAEAHEGQAAGADHMMTFEPTGDDDIDAALSSLRAMADLPAHDHAAVVERVHRVLQDRLADGQE